MMRQVLYFVKESKNYCHHLVKRVFSFYAHTQINSFMYLAQTQVMCKDTNLAPVAVGSSLQGWCE